MKRRPITDGMRRAAAASITANHRVRTAIARTALVDVAISGRSEAVSRPMVDRPLSPRQLAWRDRETTEGGELLPMRSA